MVSLQQHFNITVNKCLIIAPPWSTLILSGEGNVNGEEIKSHLKSKEMRTTQTKQRGWHGLIESKSGLIKGLIKISDSTGPYNDEQLIDMRSEHYVPEEIIKDPSYKWRHAWHLEDAFVLNNPVPYTHKNGQVIWVSLNDEDCAGLAKACHDTLSLLENAAKEANDNAEQERILKIQDELAL